jgi:hypothetical protein
MYWPACSVPAATFVIPEYVFAPNSVTVPTVVFCSVAAPASAALTVPDCRLKALEDTSVPFWILPPPCRVTPPFCVCVVPPRSRTAVAPLTVIAPLALPRVPTPASASVPAVMLVPPVYVLTPASVMVPVPALTSDAPAPPP